jgi:uncharacterized protein (DUF2164 family)
MTALLAAFMAFSLLSATAFAEDTGDGSPDNPLQIGTNDALLSFAERVTNGETTLCAELTASLTVDNWTAIGKTGRAYYNDSSIAYIGVFNGNGHKLTLSKTATQAPEANNIALFDTIGTGGVVRNLNLDVDFHGIRALAGVATINYGTIEYVTVTGTIESSLPSTESFVGGIAAYNKYKTVNGVPVPGKILHCINRASISGGSKVGGIVGNLLGEIRYCGNEGKISGASVGGLVATASGIQETPQEIFIISDCYNVGVVESSQTGNINNTSGGLFAGSDTYMKNWPNYSVSDSFSYGNIAGSGVYRNIIGGVLADDVYIIQRYSNIHFLEGIGMQLAKNNASLNGEDGFGTDLVKTVIHKQTAEAFTNGTVLAALNGTRTGGAAPWKQGELYPELKNIGAYVPDETAPVLAEVEAQRLSDAAATVKFTSSEDGTYYYEVVDSGAETPTIDTSTGGTPCDTEEQTITLNNLTAGAKDIYIVVTDAAGNESAPLKIEIPSPSDTEVPVLTAGTTVRQSDTAATVKFTSSEDGTDYYAVVASGAGIPTIDTSTGGIACSTDEQTITLSNLTAGAKDIYIVVADAAGNKNEPLKIAIPAYSSGGGNNDDTVSPVLTSGTAQRLSDAAAIVKFTSSENGTYYYAVVASGAEPPTIDTDTDGTPCGTEEQTITLNNLTAGAKDIYIVAADAAGNESAPLKIEIPSPPDTVSPVLTAGEAVRLSDAAATVKFTSSENGTYYYAVVASGANIPTINTSTGGTPFYTNSQTIILTSLTGGAKDIYIVAADAAGNKSAPIKIAIPSPPDTVSPVLTEGASVRLSDAAATVTFTSSENGTYYYAVVESGANIPTIDTSTGGTPCYTNSQTIILTGLTGGAKDIYIVAADAAGNKSAPLKIAIPSPPDTVSPVLAEVEAQRLSDAAATVKFTSSENGTYYYAVVESGAGIPTIDTSTGGTPCYTNAQTIIILTGLTGSAKDIYIVVADAEGNKSAPLKIAIPSPPDTVLPALTPGASVRLSDAEATVKFTSSEDGTYYYAVVESGAGIPTIDTSTGGTPCGTDEQTITLTGLTGGAKDIYIVAADAAGNESAPLKIAIPAYSSEDSDTVIEHESISTPELVTDQQIITPDKPDVEPAASVSLISAEDLESIPEGLAEFVTVEDGVALADKEALLSGLDESGNAAQIDRDNVKMLPILSARVSEEGKIALFTLRMNLNGFTGKTIGDLIVLKQKKDGSTERLMPAPSPEEIENALISITGRDGNALPESLVIETDGVYYLSAAIQDNSVYDWEDEPKVVIDPMALTTLKTASGDDDDIEAPVLTGGASVRLSDAEATVKFTSSEDGTYYYAVVESGEEIPTIDTSTGGTDCDTEEQTITLTGLTEGAKDIYIVVADEAGNESEPLEIEIPAYPSGGSDTVVEHESIGTPELVTQIITPDKPDVEPAASVSLISAEDLESIPEGLAEFVTVEGGVALADKESLLSGLYESGNAAQIDRDNVKMLPILSARVSEEGKIALFTLRMNLNEFTGKTIGDLIVLKQKKDGLTDRLMSAPSPEEIENALISITCRDGKALPKSLVIETDGVYYLSAAIQDNSVYDWEDEPKVVIDPMALTTLKTASGGGDDDDYDNGDNVNGGSGGCDAGTAAVIALLTCLIVTKAADKRRA